jgi:flavin reductase (DIM6/NTAB) family NADH-FMN oxidoreductase RutF
VIVRTGELDIKENYKLLISSVVPRPIAFVSTLSADGVPNLAPFSFFTAMTARPPTIGFVSSRRSGETVKKDTLHNIESGGEFVINIVTEYIAEQMHRTSADYAPEIDEFALSSLSPVPSLMVKPPRVSESPINLECKLYRMVEIGDGEPGSGTLIIGEIIIYHVDDRLLVNGRIDPALLKPVGKLAGSEYSTLGLRFTMG